MRKRKKFVYAREPLENHLKLDPLSKVDKKGFVPMAQKIAGMIVAGQMYQDSKAMMYDTDEDKPKLTAPDGRVFRLEGAEALMAIERTQERLTAMLAQAEEEKAFLSEIEELTKAEKAEVEEEVAAAPEEPAAEGQ